MDYPNQTIENLFAKFKLVIGVDYNRYKNHVYRVFYNCLIIDQQEINKEKYAIAAVFHDLGIWTNHTIDYLDPSAEQAKIYLTEIGKQNWIEEITLMIYWHHKLSKYEGAYSETAQNFRKADWMDVSLGLLTFGYDKKKINEVRAALPNLVFIYFF